MAKASVIQRSSNVLSGTPVFAGTRVPVRTLFDYLEAGKSINEFVQDFPSVTQEQVLEVLKLVKEML